jgi:hypothetical protein
MMKLLKLKIWGALFLVAGYIFVGNLFFDYIINREVPGFLQLIASLVMMFLALVVILYTTSIIVNSINLSKKKKR